MCQRFALPNSELIGVMIGASSARAIAAAAGSRSPPRRTPSIWAPIRLPSFFTVIRSVIAGVLNEWLV
ncbi:Uncharacterised protein [Mycobacterium tuberculosis]|nr:Uncharacterised protein [Mycobacterium tuberculosis]